jgi:hypothetical protein
MVLMGPMSTFVQINVHHSKAAKAVLSQKLVSIEKADTALIQEPWV